MGGWTYTNWEIFFGIGISTDSNEVDDSWLWGKEEHELSGGEWLDLYEQKIREDEVRARCEILDFRRRNNRDAWRAVVNEKIPDNSGVTIDPCDGAGGDL